MNFKKVLSIASVASLAVVGLVSCGKKEKETEGEYEGEVNISATYDNRGYITYGRGGNNNVPDSYTTVDGRQLTKNVSMAPMWQDMAANMKITINDVALEADNTQTSELNLYNAEMKGLGDKVADVIQTAQGDAFTNALDSQSYLNLSNYINDQYMPNLTKWLEAHDTVKQQLIQDEGGEHEGIYFTPYFDGLDTNEQQFNVNVDMVRALLDDASTLPDSAKTFANGSLDNDETSSFAYSSFSYDSAYIPSIDTEIEVARQEQLGTNTATSGTRIDDNNRENYLNAKYVSDKIRVTIPAGQDIISRMNALVQDGNKATGAELVNCLKTYINDIYGDYIGAGKLYANPSDVFISTSACYNADELIALLRCVRSNPAFLTGSATTSISPIVPRTGQGNRVRRLVSCMQMFGIRGLEGEATNYWITADGKLANSKSQSYSLYGLDLMHKLQEDKIFGDKNRWFGNTDTWSTDQRNSLMAKGEAFMVNDMANAAAANDKGDGFKATSITGILPPYAKWGFTYDDGTNVSNGSNNKLAGATTDSAGNKFSYTRFSEDNRSMKSGGWSINAAVAKDEKKLKKILKMFDYMYTPEGSVLECFGYNAQASDERKALAFTKRSAGETAATNYNDGADEYLALDGSGNAYVNLGDSYKAEQKTRTGSTWHNYMTMYWGSCFGIGNIRTNMLESQMTSIMQKVGVTKLGNAQTAGAYYLCQTYLSNFLASTKTTVAFTSDMKTANTAGKALDDFWTIANGTNDWKSPYAEVVYGGWSTSTPTSASTVMSYYEAWNNSTLANAGTIWDLRVDTTDQYKFQTNPYRS